LQRMCLRPLEPIVESFNEVEGYKGLGSPFAIARAQPQQDAVLLYQHLLDRIGDELRKVKQNLGLATVLPEDDNESGWEQV
jgi:hypothetical protein